MFNKLKDKLKKFFGSKEKVKEEKKVEKKKVKKKVENKKKEVKKNIKKEPSKKVEKKVKEEEKIEEEKPKKKGIFSKIFDKVKSKQIQEKDFEIFWDEFEVFLLEINIAFEIVEKIQEELRKEIIGKSFDRFSLKKKIKEVSISQISKILKNREENFLEKTKKILKEKNQVKIIFLGVNGSGKTTTISKFVNFLKKNKFSCVVSASDTFRAAAIEQLEEHSKKLNFKLIKHKLGSDPASVAFDAIEHSRAKKIDFVLIDTAGRMPNNSNLMNELEKIKRVSKSDFNIFIGDSVSGNDLLEQIKLFDKVIGIDGVILTKVDTDEKPGSVVSCAYSIEKPIYFLGCGQEYDDFVYFKAEKISKQLFEED